MVRDKDSNKNKNRQVMFLLDKHLDKKNYPTNTMDCPNNGVKLLSKSCVIIRIQICILRRAYRFDNGTNSLVSVMFIVYWIHDFFWAGS